MKVQLALLCLLLTPVSALGQVVTLEAIDDSAAEAGQDVGVLRFTRSNSTGNLTVNVAIEGSSTATINDYSSSDGGTLPVFGTVNFSNGQQTVDITLTPTLDNLVEGQEQLDLSLESGSGYTIGSPSSGSILIADDPPVVTLEAADGDAAGAGQDPFVFRASRTGGNINQALTVNVTIDPGNSADTFNDFSADDGGTLQVFERLAIPGGSAAHEITFTPVLDNRVEAPETFAIALAGGSYLASGAPNTAGAVIADDPPIVSITAATPTAIEGYTPGVLRFERTGGNPNQILTVNASFSVASSATTGDFSADDGGTLVVFGTTTIGAGNANRDIVLTAVQDQLEEGEEELIVVVDPGGYLVGDPGSATILFLDTPPPLFKDGFEGN